MKTDNPVRQLCECAITDRSSTENFRERSGMPGHDLAISFCHLMTRS